MRDDATTRYLSLLAAQVFGNHAEPATQVVCPLLCQQGRNNGLLPSARAFSCMMNTADAPYSRTITQ